MLTTSTSPSTNLAITPLPTAHCLDTSEIVARFPHLPARFTTSPLALKRINELFRAKHGHDSNQHAEAEAVLFQLDQLDKALGKVLVEEGLLFRGGSVSGEAILAELTKD